MRTSTPVRAVVPEEKARATRKASANPVGTAVSASICQPALSARISSPEANRIAAKMIMVKIATMNR